MPRRILILQGHPDASERHFGHALAEAYAGGAREAGHEVRHVEIAALHVPLLRSAKEWEHEPVPPSLAAAQEDIAWAEHLLLLYPLWLGDMPAMLKAFLEQVARPGFAFKGERTNPFMHKGLTGRSARVVVTMGMPALVYRWYFRAHSLKSLERNILGFVGIAPIEHTLVGGVGALAPSNAKRWLGQLRKLGEAGE